MNGKRILLLRHGETDWNAQKRFQGRQDIPLNDAGRRQAAAVSLRVRRWRPEAVWSSPQRRAMETAMIALQCGSDAFSTDSNLCEVGFGVWEGALIAELEQNNDPLYQAWKRAPFTEMPEGAETAAEVMQRADRVLKTIAKSSAERCLVVAHGGILRAIIAQAAGFSFESAWNLKFSNCSLSGLEYNGSSFSVAFLNDTAHQCAEKNSAEKTLPVLF